MRDWRECRGDVRELAGEEMLDFDRIEVAMGTAEWGEICDEVSIDESCMSDTLSVQEYFMVSRWPAYSMVMVE